MNYKIKNYTGVVGIVYTNTNPKKFAVVQTERGFSLPGGGIEESDSSLESALYRELKEELGLNKEDIEIENINMTESFIYGKDKVGRSNKKASRLIFLVKTKNNKLSPEDIEIINADWYSYQDAIKIFTWKNSKETLDKFKYLLDKKQ
ncbi:MAG: NUDIX hydrolase [Patescibacteria group bacterium]|nr:NUDIX hydrolase [Patescibacteria group bacterium]MDD4304661.1 NUDIX hydrolase [Patescibacteria group bacterium]MDD4695698.1 NUDIX hydrolase [Patescibacteria group bacterium]